MKKFSCRRFFEKAVKSGPDKEKIAEKFFADEDKMKPCDFEQCEDEIGFAPEKHLINNHGFLEKAPYKNKRSLEVELCKLVEKYLPDS